MGRDFRAPRHDDLDRWRTVEIWLAHGFAFWSYGVGFPRQSARRGGSLRNTRDFQMERDWPDIFGRTRPNLGRSEST
jgi:hypothetical protein